MKKFTEIFLRDGLGILQVSRKIGLSLVMMLFTFLSFSQEAQSTYELWADPVVSCYNGTNTYEVPVSMKDFVNIQKFELVLKYDAAKLDFSGLTQIHSQLSAITVVESPAGTITLSWSSATPVTILSTDVNNPATKVKVMQLNFKLDGFPFYYGTGNVLSIASAISWDAATYYQNNVTQAKILTFLKMNGSLTVNQNWTEADLAVAITPANCYGGQALVTVTAPGATQYSWNGTTFTPLNNTNVTVPAPLQLLQVKSATGNCVSYIKQIDVPSPTVLTYTSATPVYTTCPGGFGDIEIKAAGGSPVYTYYVIPDEQWSAGDQMYQKLIDASSNLETFLNKYKYSSYVSQVPAGTVEAPKYYWVAVTDSKGCGVITGTNLLSWWKKVAVIDNKPAWAAVGNIAEGEGTVQFKNATCNNNDGKINITVSGGTPWTNGYTIYVNGAALAARSFTYNVSTLATGDYTIVFQDMNGCKWEKKYTITRPKPIVFTVNHTDTGCQQAVGELWISSVDASTGSGALSLWKWEYSTHPSFANNVTTVASIYTKVTNLPAGIYYVRIIDATNCWYIWTNAQGDNAIKILDTDFNVTYTPISCFGGGTTVTITPSTGSGGHVFEYSRNGGATWQTSGVFVIPPFGLNPVKQDTTINFMAKDVTAANCIVSLTTKIVQPTNLNAYIIPYLTVPPTCPEGTDGNIAIQVNGGTPFALGQYEFKVDNGNWVKRDALFTYTMDVSMHKIFIRDAKGCATELWFDFPNFKDKISFVDTIKVGCPMDKVNLFNGIPETCQETAFGFCVDGVDMDAAYFKIWESQWHGLPLEHFLGANFNPAYVPLIKSYLLSLGLNSLDIDALVTLATNIGYDPVQIQALLTELNIEGVDLNNVDWTKLGISYQYWTSDRGWKTAIVQGIQPLRNPVLYISSQYTTGSQIVANGAVLNHKSAFGAGTYYVVAIDEFGCYSNVEKIVIWEPKKMTMELTAQDAGCYGSIDGAINIKVMNANGTMIPGTPFGNPTMQYTVANNPMIFSKPGWPAQVSWLPVPSSNFTITAQAGTYYIAVRDYCAIDHPELIVIKNVEVKSAPAVAIDRLLVTVKNITCNLGEAGPTNDGAILIPLSAVSGGFGDYTFTLAGPTTKPSNKTGQFTGLKAGVYTVTVTDVKGCVAVYTFSVTQPDAFWFSTEKVYPSCFNQHDGVIRYSIYGGTAPYFETTNNVGQYENVTSIPENRWYKVDNGIKVGNATVFDRRVRNGNYEIYVKDSKGCIFGPVVVEILQPAELGIASSLVVKAGCAASDGLVAGNQANGSITVTPKGGWNLVDNFRYYVELWLGTSIKQTSVIDVLAPVTFTGLVAGTYTVKVYESRGTDKPYITDPTYFTNWANLAKPYQNADVSACFYLQNFVVEAPAKITYNVKFNPVTCYNTNTGSINITNVAGGVQPYSFAIEGPTGSGYETAIWKSVLTGVTKYDWLNLKHGHYNIWIRDANGCTIFKESGEVNNVDSLRLNMKLIENAKCNGGNGKIEVLASGGVGGYQYAVVNETFNFVNVDLTTLPWQASAIFEKPAGVWIGFVKDANGCVQGFPTVMPGGAVIMNHRVTIIEPSKVTLGTVTSTLVKCWGGNDGTIIVTNLAGGSNSGWNAIVTGKNYLGVAITKSFSAVDMAYASSMGTLKGLEASTDKAVGAILTDADKYTVVFYDANGCASDPVKIAVQQPRKFIITVRAKQDAFICNTDKAGLYDIIVVSGGTPWPSTTAPYNFKYKWEAYKDAAMTQKVDSLTGTYGFTPTFLGYANLYYKVQAMDYNGCLSAKDTFIKAPAPVVFDIKDVSCYGDALASAKIFTTGETGRQFRVAYYQIFGTTPIVNPVYTTTPWFTEMIYLNKKFSYGDTNEKQGHYVFFTEDDKGCRSLVDTFTFNAVQHPLAFVESINEGECTASGNITITGGTSPYIIAVDNVLVTGTGAPNFPIAFTVNPGTHVIKVIDKHECELIKTITVNAKPVVRTATATTYVGEKVKFVDAEAKVDTMLAAGTHTFTYVFNTCTRTLVVTVNQVVMQVPIKTIQGEVAVSPLVGKVRGITGTVSGVVAGVGFYVQDANAAWSGIWVIEPGTVVMEGNGVIVEGTVSEENSVTSLTSTKTSVINPPLVVTPIVVASPQAAEAEMYESVLVTVKGARAADPLTNGTWPVYTAAGNDVVIGKIMYPFVPVVGDFYTVTGVVNGQGTIYKVEPRKLADIVNLKTTGIQEVNSLQFKVYPNPFNDHLNIDNNDKLTRVTVTNIAGQRVIDVQYPDRVIRTTNLVGGVYVVTLFNESGSIKSERLVKR